MKTIKTKVVAIIMAVAMVFALGMTAFAATGTQVNVSEVSLNQEFNEGDMIYINTQRNPWTINDISYSSRSTYTIPSGKTGTVTALSTRQRSMTIALSDIPTPPGPEPTTSVDFDDITEGSTLNGGDKITNNNHHNAVTVDINDGESSASIPNRGSYTIPDGMTATVTDKSSGYGRHTLAITLTAAPNGGDTSGLTPEQRRALSIDAFVENMYIDVLGRNFDSEGRASFIAALNGNEMTGSDVVRAMFNSEEYAARNQTDEEFIATLCQVMAHRAPTDAEIATWTTALASGTTRAQVVDTFLATEEFANVCAFFQVNV
ncbi:MAG: DUF4214 domain-containing protein [Clostridiales bacterium]|nr:DUF4214 domain-containing protein [Clostridiales bacterium]